MAIVGSNFWSFKIMFCEELQSLTKLPRWFISLCLIDAFSNSSSLVMPLQHSKLPQTRDGTQCSLSNTHLLKVKSKSWSWKINYECSVLSGSYKHVIHVSIELLHSHLPDGAGVIYTDVMHHLLPLSLSLVDLWSFNMPLAACCGTASHSGQAGSWLRLTEPFRVLHLWSCFV